MAKGNMFRHKWVVAVGMVFFLMWLTGCQEEGLPEEEGAVVSLHAIPNNLSHASLPLIGTQWKLVGFVNGAKNKIRLAMPHGEDTYLLVFDEDGRISGRTSTNTATGRYSVDIASNRITISEFTHLTKINELFDGKYYIDVMNKVSAVKLSAQGLELYYDNSNYLLFQPLMHRPSPSFVPH